MTVIAIKDIGFCAHFSRQGDWAFEFALSQAKRLKSRLNIFYFPGLQQGSSIQSTGQLQEDEVVALDRRVREYYDDKLGDFEDVGFRVCEDMVPTELRRCLFRREYQVMVVGYLGYGAMFGDNTIESFAWRFNGPIVLVGPDWHGQLCLNPPARVVSWQLGLADNEWMPLADPAEVEAL